VAAGSGAGPTVGSTSAWPGWYLVSPASALPMAKSVLM
jgi:hypothetical protein